MPESIAMREAFGQTLVELGKRVPELLVLDADVAPSTRAVLFAQAFPERFIQVGIAEQNMVGMAAGLSTLGFIPFTSTFACFAAKRDLDQVRIVVAQPKNNVKITGHYSGLIAGKTGKTHLSVQDLAIMRCMPNMTVIAPADGVEVARAMEVMVAEHGPMYLRLSRDPSPVIFDPSYRFELGKAVLLREGGEVALVSTGTQTARTLEAADMLKAEGISALVLHVPTLKPLDVDAIVAAADRTGLVITAEEHSILGGLGGAVAEILSEHLPTPLSRVGVRDVNAESAPNDDLLEKYGLTARHVADAARSHLAKWRR
ncbi:MAG TPA: transketolase C-terminal domain-containing protein [Candidatus Methylomirabilis sp.]|nr:transketolase C-terminal domain-containing protein [Candidatus Methylomirabilis sp.]HSC71968.1 transketolase C-terminal domain-containing protein [Candidatus Methylomirabilis sp.]